MMLSTLHPSHPSMTPSYPQPSPAMSSMTTSLPIIPPPRQGPARPKLSINTEQPRILGKGASLRLDTLSAASPTVRNTFTNAYERPSTAPTLQRPTRPSLSIESGLTTPISTNNNNNTNSASTPSSASTLSSAITSASNESAICAIPYKQPHNLTSILTNSPARSIIPRNMSSSRPMFPAEKHVCFRTPLEEEITTTRYTMAHSDLESSISTLSTVSSVASSTATTDSNASAEHHSLVVNTSNNSSNASISPLQLSLQSSTSTFSSNESSPRKKGPRTGEKRDSSSSEDDSDSCPETPIAGRRKRTRDWRWTLGPLPSDKSSSSASDATASEDSS